MKLKVYVSMSLVCLLLVSGCSKSATDSNGESTFTKAMSEGKLALASQEYEKAEGMFSLAMQENKDDKESNNLYNQTVLLIEAKELIEDDKFKEAKAKLIELEGIDSNLDILKKEADKLLEDINLKLSNDEESVKEDSEAKKDVEPVKEEVKKKDVEVVENESSSQNEIIGSDEQTEEIEKPAKEYITVPEMAGWYPGENDTSGLNIVTGNSTLTSSYAARGIVATQSIAPGTEVEKGTTIYISLYSFDNHYDPMTSEHDCELENCN